MKKAFTMIELVFVIAILGVLGGVAIPKLTATRDDAEVAKVLANIKTAYNDILAYYTANGYLNPNFTLMTKVSLDQPILYHSGFKIDIANNTTRDDYADVTSAVQFIFNKKLDSREQANITTANGVSGDSWYFAITAKEQTCVAFSIFKDSEYTVSPSKLIVSVGVGANNGNGGKPKIHGKSDICRKVYLAGKDFLSSLLVYEKYADFEDMVVKGRVIELNKGTVDF